MTIKQHGGIFGRNPTFNNAYVEGDLTVDGQVSVPADSISGDAINGGTATPTNVDASGDLSVGGDVNFDSDGWRYLEASDRVYHFIDDTASSFIPALTVAKNRVDDTGSTGLLMGVSSVFNGLKGGVAFTRTTSFGRGNLHLLNNNAASSASADIADAGLTLLSNGNVSIPNGNVVLASGNGIDFSATAGTGTSELFDDYEEGTWTPSFQNYDGTPSGVNAVYTKIGNTVAIHLSATFDGTSDASTFRVTGLPFQPSTECALALGRNTGDVDATVIVNTSSQIRFYDNADAEYSYNGYGASAKFRVTGVYFTAS